MLRHLTEVRAGRRVRCFVLLYLQNTACHSGLLGAGDQQGVIGSFEIMHDCWRIKSGDPTDTAGWRSTIDLSRVCLLGIPAELAGHRRL